MTSMLLLGIEASRRWNASPMQLGIQHETRIFEFLLPIVACGFAFGSIPEQMKNFFATGLETGRPTRSPTSALMARDG